MQLLLTGEPITAQRAHEIGLVNEVVPAAELRAAAQAMAERIGLAENAMATDRTVIAHGAAPDQVAVHIHRFREFRVHWLTMCLAHVQLHQRRR